MDPSEYKRSLFAHNITTTFLNGEKLEIVYNFDPSRPEEDRIYINVGSLLPLFGGILLPTMEDFTSVSKLRNFVKTHVHLSMCSDYQHASCPCHLVNNGGQCGGRFVRPLVEACNYGHFHHYCYLHVIYWIDFSLCTSIWHKETKMLIDEKAVENFLMFLKNNSFSQHERAAMTTLPWKELQEWMMRYTTATAYNW
ncbi:c4.2 [Tranosema rostrale ichnovirus]|nr:c4.2 [Tranosema rostrale ichnovirus]